MISQTELPTTRTNNDKMNMDLNSSFGFHHGKTADSRHKKQSSLLLAPQPATRTMSIVDDTLKVAQGIVLHEHLNHAAGQTS